MRRRIGIVFQSFNLFPHMDVMANVTLGPRRAHGMPRAEAEDRARELLGRFGLGDKVDEFPNRLSGGQNQRAAIVRALMGDPEILLLDEVTSALDPELVGEVLGAIRELSDQGMTMVLATHEMGFARDVATSGGLPRSGSGPGGGPAGPAVRPADPGAHPPVPPTGLGGRPAVTPARPHGTDVAGRHRPRGGLSRCRLGSQRCA